MLASLCKSYLELHLLLFSLHIELPYLFTIRYSLTEHSRDPVSSYFCIGSANFDLRSPACLGRWLITT
jgi:hypothetical protein